MTTTPTTRSAAFYRTTLAVAAIGVGYVAASGRLASYFRFFLDSPRSAAPPEGVFAQHMTTSLIWIASFAPLLYASWELGRQHVSGRRLGHSILSGLPSVVRIAIRGELAPGEARAFDRAPSDRPLRAALWSALVAVAVPAFFLIAPPMQTPRAIIRRCRESSSALSHAASSSRARPPAPRAKSRRQKMARPTPEDIPLLPTPASSMQAARPLAPTAGRSRAPTPPASGTARPRASQTRR